MQAAKLASQQGQRVSVFTDINSSNTGKRGMHNNQSMHTHQGMTQCTSTANQGDANVISSKEERISSPIISGDQTVTSKTGSTFIV